MTFDAGLTTFVTSSPRILLVAILLCDVSRPFAITGPNYVIDTLVVVDLSGVRKWMEVSGKSTQDDFRLEFNSTFYEVSQLFKSLEHYNLKIEARIKQWTFLNVDIFQTRTFNGMSQKMSAESAVDVFKKWVQQQGYSFDMAVLYTGFDISSSSSFLDSNGYAYIGGVCTSSAVAVVEMNGLYQAVLTTAHEMGHILGAEHDGTRSTMACNSNSGYLMNPRTSIASGNHFYFSSCSAYLMKTKLDQLNQAKTNCLINLRDSKPSPGPRFGEFQSADDVCRRAFGSHSYVARHAYESYGDDVCVQLACMTQTVGTNFYWKFTMTPPGLPCGQNKRCSLGKCVTSTNGWGSTMTSDTCPFGDQPRIEGDYQTTCSALAPLQCSGWEKACCHSCHVTSPGQNVTADDVCRHVVGSESSLARKAYSYYGDQLCKQLACLTSVRGTYFSWNYVNTPDGLACGKKRRCQQGRCVFSQTGSDVMSDSCPYGDQPWVAGDYQTTCDVIANRLGCRGWENVCCQTCGR